MLLLICPNIDETLATYSEDAMEFRDGLDSKRICAEVVDDRDGDDSVDARGSKRKHQGISYEGLVADVLLFAAIDKSK